MSTPKNVTSEGTSCKLVLLHKKNWYLCLPLGSHPESSNDPTKA